MFQALDATAKGGEGHSGLELAWLGLGLARQRRLPPPPPAALKPHDATQAPTVGKAEAH